MEVWNQKFGLYRNRNWMKEGICKSCEGFKDCQGGAFHLRKPDCEDPIFCHFKRQMTKD
jgi:MoaA/NifB/PqqE/SkfB family radical SAM enzyme